jgi:hypothetical protein
MDEYKRFGYWTIPSLGGYHEIYGYLLFEERRFKLVLTGEVPRFKKPLVKFPIIYGRSKIGGYTLIDVIWQNAYGVNFNTNVVENTLICYKIILGHVFKSKTELVFNTFKFNFLGLREWLDKSKPKINYRFKGVTINYDSPKNIKFVIDDKTDGEFDFELYKYPIIKSAALAEIKQNEYVILRSKGQTTLEKFVEITNKLLTFFSLSINKRIATFHNIFQSSFIKDDNNRNEDIHFIDHNREVDLKLPSGFVFPYKYTDIEDEFENIIQKWFEIVDVLSPISNIYLNFFHESFNPSNKFLLLSQAIETFHARFRHYIDSDTYTRNEVNRRYYTPYYKTRVKRVLNYFYSDVSQEYYDETEIEELSEKIVKTRDYYTHYLRENESLKFSDAELRNYTRKLIKVLHILILIEIGFTKDSLSGYIGFTPFEKFTSIKDIPIVDNIDKYPKVSPKVLEEGIHVTINKSVSWSAKMCVSSGPQKEARNPYKLIVCEGFFFLR